jgi:DNA helicase-2/ATP-dependent DNA helicase PcrA
MDERQWTEEQNYLHHVQDVLDKLRHTAEQATDRRMRELLEHRRYMWENVAHDAANEETRILQAQHVSDLASQEREHEVLQNVVRQYERIQRNPYFGRMDFHEQGQQTAEKIYIGIATVREPEDLSLLVYDWRAPICSLYYDFSPGAVEYNTPEGPVSGTMTLKRQYMISGRTLEAMFDTDVRIGDEILQTMLAKHADDKMSSIVTSIQKEQNRAIRNLNHRVFIVQGPAGSGKTSIALQRVAYLLYIHRHHVTADNILLFAPNNIFQDYVSNVLPELGESNVLQDTFQDYVRGVFDIDAPFEDFYTHMEGILTADEGSSNDKAAAIAFKFSHSFYECMRRYVAYLGEQGMPFEDLAYRGRPIVRAQRMTELFYGPLKRYNLPARFQHLTSYVDRVLHKVEEKLQQRFEQKLLAKNNYIGTDEEIHQMSCSKAAKVVRELKSAFRRQIRSLPMRLYVQLFENADTWSAVTQGLTCPNDVHQIRNITVETLRSGKTIPYEDTVPLVYLYSTVVGPAVKKDIRHVLVDEAQDYTWLQYETMRRIFPRSGFTILGDMHQSIHPYMNRDEFHDLGEVFDEGQVAFFRLTKSYRSTREIMQFAQSVLGEPDVSEPIRTSGEAPAVVRADADTVCEAVLEHIRRYQAAGDVSIAIICRTAARAQSMWNALPPDVQAVLFTKDDRAFRTGVVVVPSYLTKGLEFDAVIVPDAADYKVNEKRLFYTVCTRALHHLTVIDCGGAELLREAER